MQELVAGDDLLFALVDDHTQNNRNAVSMTGMYVSTAPEHAIDNTPLTTYRFSPNTVLTSSDLSESLLFSTAGFHVRFQFAEALSSISLTGWGLNDDTLAVLAETYRNRMKNLGLGGSAAWNENFIAEERSDAMGRIDTTKTSQACITTGTTSDYGSRRDTGAKIFTAGRVPGGQTFAPIFQGYHQYGPTGHLVVLCRLVSLDISDSPRLTLELFRGSFGDHELVQS